ncbi:putative leader peptide [Kitasatospora sp. NPDC004723]
MASGYCQCSPGTPKVARMAAGEFLAARRHVDLGRLASALCTAAPA